MYIQYIGCNVAASSRIYNYDVLDTKEKREFTVQVQSEAFRPSGLKLQDGPDICFARLEQELQGETQEARSEAHLSIGERDIQEYLGRHQPRKPSSSRRSGADPDRVENTLSYGIKSRREGRRFQ
jgi:hypothetical protein